MFYEPALSVHMISMGWIVDIDVYMDTHGMHSNKRPFELDRRRQREREISAWVWVDWLASSEWWWLCMWPKGSRQEEELSRIPMVQKIGEVQNRRSADTVEAVADIAEDHWLSSPSFQTWTRLSRSTRCLGLVEKKCRFRRLPSRLRR
jgi:hypothetical protein